MDDNALRQYYEEEGLVLTDDDYFTGFYQTISTHATRLHQLKKWLRKIKRTETFCEIGCNIGYFTHYVAKRGVRAIGVDLSLNKINVAQYIAKRKNLNCEYHRMDATDLKFPDKSFDYVLSSQVLEHLRDDRKAIEELFRITRSKVIITVPKKGWYWNIFNRMFHTHTFEALGHGHFREYTTESLKQKLDHDKFTIEQIKYCGFVTPVHDMILKRFSFMQAIICVLLRRIKI